MTIKPIDILGYDFTILYLSSGYITAHVPNGDTQEDKALFDKLVYNNTRLLSGKDESRIIENITNFIINNK